MKYTFKCRLFRGIGVKQALLISAIGWLSSCTHNQSSSLKETTGGEVVNDDTMTQVSSWEHLWRYQADGYIESNLVLADNQVLFVTQDFSTSEFAINSVNIKTGDLNWKYKAQRKIFWNECLSDSLLIFGDAAEIIYCIDWRTGKENYKIQTPYLNIRAPMIIDNHRNKIAVFTANISENTGYAGNKITNKLLAIDIPSGNLKWTNSSNVGTAVAVQLRGENYIVYNENRPYVDSLFMIDCNNGEQIWASVCPALPTGVMTFVDGTVLMGCANGSVCMADISLGGMSEIRPANFQYPATSPVMVSDSNEIQIIYGTGYNYLSVSLSQSGGKIKWLYDLQAAPSPYRTLGQAVAKPLVYDSIVFIGSARELYALNRETGKELWDYPFGPHSLVYSPIVSLNPRTLLFANDDKTLYAITF